MNQKKEWQLELINVSRRDGQVVTFGLETGFISCSGRSEFLAFGRHQGSLVGVALGITVLFVSVSIVSDNLHFLPSARPSVCRVIRLAAIEDTPLKLTD